MKQTRLPLLAVVPVTVISIVVALPFIVGNHPVRWESGSLMPHLVLDDGDNTRHKASTAASPSDTNAVSKVDKKWKEGMPQWGLQIYWENNPKHSLAYIEKQARLQADYAVGLHANSISISFPFFTRHRSSSKINGGDKTPPPERLGRVLEIFHEAGFRTTLRPLMDETSLKPEKGWRGSIKPANRDAWFASYKKFVTPYLEVANKEKLTTFVIATELNSLEGDPHWHTVVDDAESLFDGEVAYDANWDSYVSGPVTMPVTHLGIDAYFPLKVDDDASVGTLVAGWNKWLDKKAKGTLPKITISEAGIGAMKGAYHTPSDFHSKRAVDPQVQANWYTAICQVVQERKMSGVYWWSVYFDDDPNTKPDDKVASRLDFAGRPLTEKAIKSCFTSDYAGPGTDTVS